nr:hypothetical protein CFP56_20668 [Quercus suber]
MVVVAIAGTGGVGRTILDAFARSVEHQIAADEPRRFAVDYSDIDQIKQVLQKQNVTVVVSALLLVDDSATQSQNNLIRAAASSGTLEAEAELRRHPQLTWTLIRVGIFLDHLTRPYNPKKTYIEPMWTFVDIEHEKCVFPGNGSYPLVLTHSMDLAAYIERLVGFPAEQWPHESLVASNKLQVKDLDTMIRRVTGIHPSGPKAHIKVSNDGTGRNFEVTYDSVEAVRKGHITPLPSNQAVFSNPVTGETFRQVEHQIMLSMLSNAHDLPGRNLAEIFPDVQPTDIEEFFRAGWELKQDTARKQIPT